MTRNYLSLALTVSALALAGCAKNQTNDTQNPDGTGAVGGQDGAGDGADQGDAVASRARTSTAPRGKARNTKARTVTAAKPPREPDQPGDDDPVEGPHGLFVEAFALDAATGLPDFASLGAPIQTFVVPNLDFDGPDASAGFPGFTKLTQNYALRFSGSINIVDEAEYELCLHSDDGSQLLLEDTLLVNNDGVHDGAVEACELVYLPPGEYRLAVHYFQGTGAGLAMHFAWGMDGGDRSIVPSSVLYKPASAG